MANIYIDNTNGDDTTGDGSSGNPYQTMSKAFSVFAAGDTIKVANTSAQVMGDLAYPAAITTADAWLIIEGWDNGGSEVIERPTGNLTDVGVIQGKFTGSKNYIKLRNLKIQNYNVVNSDWFIGNQFCVLENLDFDSTMLINAGTIIKAGTSTVVRFCSFRGIVPAHASSGDIIIPNGANVYINNNYFYDCKRCIKTDGQVAATIINNIFDNSEGYCVSVNGDRTQIINNTFIGDGSANNYGITFASTTTEHISIYNNHFQNFSGSGAAAVKNDAIAWPTTAGSFDLVGYNSFYNNTDNYIASGNFAASIMTDLRSADIQEVAEPLENVAGKNYAKKTTALSYGNSSYGNSWNYTQTIASQTVGAVNAASGGGGGGGGETSHVSG